MQLDILKIVRNNNVLKDNKFLILDFREWCIQLNMHIWYNFNEEKNREWGIVQIYL